MSKPKIVLSKLIEKIRSKDFKENNRIAPTDFCRSRKLPFSCLVITFINRLTKSLSVELTKFFLNFNLGEAVSKQSFSKARYKLKPNAFIDLNETFVKSYYSYASAQTHQLFKNKYLILGVDGSNYELPWTDDIVNEFGCADNKMNKQPRAMATGVKIFDLLNEMTIVSRISTYKTSETSILDKLLSSCLEILNSCQKSPCVLVGDTYYSGFGRFIFMKQIGIHAVFRCKPSFCREVKRFMKSKNQSENLRIDLHSDHRRRWRLKNYGIENPPKYLELRAIKFKDGEGQCGCLLSSIPNISNQDTVDDNPIHGLTDNEIKEIYLLRYGIEVSFYFEKMKAEVENFATKKAIGIYQEWYANHLALNITQLLIEEAQLELDKENKGNGKTSKKHNYKINKSVAIGIMKDEIPKLLFGQENINLFTLRMVKIIKRFREPIRKNRSVPRIVKHKLKYNLNQRRVK